jgi:hypothetical protein
MFEHFCRVVLKIADEVRNKQGYIFLRFLSGGTVMGNTFRR